jgi:putative membrane protein insertion efficiency factor
VSARGGCGADGARPAVGIPARMCIGLVRLYQATLSRAVGGHCRFHPSCSHYSVDALRAHGALRGSWLTIRRLARCHPWGGQGHDPAPPR